MSDVLLTQAKTMKEICNYTGEVYVPEFHNILNQKWVRFEDAQKEIQKLTGIAKCMTNYSRELEGRLEQAQQLCENIIKNGSLNDSFNFPRMLLAEELLGVLSGRSAFVSSGQVEVEGRVCSPHNGETHTATTPFTGTLRSAESEEDSRESTREPKPKAELDYKALEKRANRRRFKDLRNLNLLKDGKEDYLKSCWNLLYHEGEGQPKTETTK